MAPTTQNAAPREGGVPKIVIVAARLDDTSTNSALASRLQVWRLVRSGLTEVVAREIAPLAHGVHR